MNIAMEQMNSVRSSAAKTLCCAPLRKLHESVFIDMVGPSGSLVTVGRVW